MNLGCDCTTFAPPMDDGTDLCGRCGGRLAKKQAGGEPKGVILTDDEVLRRITNLEREQRQIQLRIQSLKADLTKRAAGRQQAEA